MKGVLGDRWLSPRSKQQQGGGGNVVLTTTTDSSTNKKVTILKLNLENGVIKSPRTNFAGSSAGDMKSPKYTIELKSPKVSSHHPTNSMTGPQENEYGGSAGDNNGAVGGDEDLKSTFFSMEDEIKAFHMYASVGDLQKLKKLLKKSYFMELICSTDKDGSTALHKAASKNKFSAIKLLLESGAKVDALDIVQSTPLHWACANGHLEATQILCKYNAQVNVKDKYGYSPLHLCLRKKEYKVADFLLLMGADLNFKKGDGQTVLHNCSEKGDIQTLTWLLSKPKILINRKDKAGNTPVMLAAAKGHVKVVEMLMKKDLQSCTIRNECNENMIHLAAYAGHKAIVFLVASLSPSICNTMLNEYDIHNKTPLHHSVQTNQFQMVKTLLNMGAEVNPQDSLGNTPLHYAIKNSDVKIARFLIQSGAKMDIKNKNNETQKQLAQSLNILDEIMMA